MSHQILIYIVYGVAAVLALVALVFLYNIFKSSFTSNKNKATNAEKKESKSFFNTENNKNTKLVVDKAKIKTDAERAAILDGAPVISTSQVTPSKDAAPKPGSFFDSFDDDDFRLP